MSTRLLLKTLFFIMVLFLLVLMGMHNRNNVDFMLPPFLKQAIQQPAALMYFAFFAIGVLTGAIFSVGPGREGGKSKDK